MVASIVIEVFLNHLLGVSFTKSSPIGIYFGEFSVSSRESKKFLTQGLKINMFKLVLEISQSSSSIEKIELYYDEY